MANFIKIFKAIFLIVIISSLLLTFTYSAPPPSCTIQSAGCYKTGDVKVGFNELKPEEFGYFLLEDKCIKTGNCDCKGISDSVISQTNPDDSSGACTCIAGAEWNANGLCCGDDTDDCGKLSSGSICSIDSKGEVSAWISSESSFGDIKYIGCSDSEHLSDGSTWIKCEDIFWKKTVSDNEYICIGKGRASIAECCGDGPCNSITDGQRLTTGQYVNYSGTANATSSSIANQSTGNATLSQKPTIGIQFSDGSCESQIGEIKYTPEGSGQSDWASDTNTYDPDCAKVYLSSALETNGKDFRVGIQISDDGCGNGGEIKYTPWASENGGASDWAKGSTGTDFDCGKIIIEQRDLTDKVITDVRVGIQISDSSDCSSQVGEIKYTPWNHSWANQSAIASDWASDTNNYDPNCIKIFLESLTLRIIPSSTQQSTAAISSNTSIISATYYCSADGKFVTDLDALGLQSTCEKAGFTWTGTKCCGEPEDINEHYNDVGGLGGCWNSSTIISVSFVNNTNDSVINYNGEFHGCAIDKSIFNINNNLLSIKDTHTDTTLITNHNYCFVEPENNYYCSYTEKWMLTNGDDKTHLSYTPITNLSSTQLAAECCSSSQCWDGAQCIESQNSDPFAQPFNGERCIDGNWTSSTLKFTPDGSLSGYCPKESQCLVDPFANATNQCIESGQYIEDNYCENGNWTSRTKLLALKMIKLKLGDYILFCDSVENTLNYLDYIVGSDEIAADILENFDTNNFCILSYGTIIISGTSINQDIEKLSSTDLGIFGVTSCSAALINDSQYHACDTTNKVWYNKNLKSIIYSPVAINIPTDTNPLASFDQYIGNPIKNTINNISALITDTPFDESYKTAFKRFDRIYFTQQSNKNITGAIEGPQIKNAVVGYLGFSADICNFVEQFNKANKDEFSGIECGNKNNNYYVLSQGSQFTSINPENIWLDLTSKLRIE